MLGRWVVWRVAALFSNILVLGNRVEIADQAHDSNESVAAPTQSCPTLQKLRELRRIRHSLEVLDNVSRLNNVTRMLEDAMETAYMVGENNSRQKCSPVCARPGNFHGIKSHSYYVNAIAGKHPSLSFDSVQSIVATEWYHPGLTAKSLWCATGCGEKFPLARLLDKNFELIEREVKRFFLHSDAGEHLRGVGTHTSQFDKHIAGNGTWTDVRLWRGRAYNKRLCERHFRVTCSIIEASPEVWTNPWSHVLLSILAHDSWVPFHQGHTNGQLTYHLPVVLPQVEGDQAELALIDDPDPLSDGEEASLFRHKNEHIVHWHKGQTLVFDDSFTHAVRYKTRASKKLNTAHTQTPDQVLQNLRVVLLMRGWHPELEPEERRALREFVRRGGEEIPEGYALLPISSSVFRM